MTTPSPSTATSARDISLIAQLSTHADSESQDHTVRAESLVAARWSLLGMSMTMTMTDPRQMSAPGYSRRRSVSHGPATKRPDAKPAEAPPSREWPEYVAGEAKAKAYVDGAGQGDVKVPQAEAAAASLAPPPAQT